MTWQVTLAADLHAQADAFAARGNHAEAARCYRETAAHYRAKGDEQAALVLDSQADQHTPALIGYRSRSADRLELRRLYTGAKFEPYYGCYLGVNCFSDPEVNGDFNTFCKTVGKRHALAYEYSGHGRVDSNLLAVTSANGPYLQLACEIDCGLNAVVPGPELDAWARQLASVRAPVFLRWGSEMNGDWVNWSGNPALYINKWRLVHDTMQRLAPNVAMVWCPNAVPAARIDRYYPGDAFVDWVGVNFYVVSIHDNNPRCSASHENPADLFRHVYEKYAARKPMMICETGVTHFAAAIDRLDASFAEARIGHLYGCLPRLYPRLKAICYYDVDNLEGTATGRPFNNYLLTDSARVLGAYKRAISPDYFLSGLLKDTDRLPQYIERLADGMTLAGAVHLSAWAKSYDLSPTVQYRIDGKLVGSSQVHGTYDCTLDCNAISEGQHTLTLTMLERPGGAVLKQTGYKIRTQHQADTLRAAPEQRLLPEHVAGDVEDNADDVQQAPDDELPDD